MVELSSTAKSPLQPGELHHSWRLARLGSGRTLRPNSGAEAAQHCSARNAAVYVDLLARVRAATEPSACPTKTPTIQDRLRPLRPPGPPQPLYLPYAARMDRRVYRLAHGGPPVPSHA